MEKIQHAIHKYTSMSLQKTLSETIPPYNRELFWKGPSYVDLPQVVWFAYVNFMNAGDNIVQNVSLICD